MQFRFGAAKESPETPVWFMLIDPSFTHTLRCPWFVDVPSNGLVFHFLEKINALGWGELEDPHGAGLKVWKLPTPQPAREVMKKKYLASIKPPGEISEDVGMGVEEVREVEGKGRGKGKAKEKVKQEVKAARLLLPSDGISLYLKEPASSSEIRVLVQVPARAEASQHLPSVPAATDQLGTVPNQDLERFLRECRGVIINIADAENPLTLDDVRRNGFEDEDNRNTGPGFVQTFWTNMVDKLDVESADNDLDTSKLLELLPPEIRGRLHLRTSGDEGRSDVEPKGQDIIFHLVLAAFFKDKFWSHRFPKRLNEEDTNHTFFNRFAKSGMLPANARCLFRQPWPMTLAVRVDGQRMLKTYTPVSNFSIWINGFPRLVWEVCSDQRAHKDELRMRAYGTSVVKLGNCILVDRHEPPHFILVAIYQTDLNVDFSLFYEQNGKIYQRGDTLNLTSMGDRAEFTRRLYRLAKMFKSENEDPFKEHSFAKGLAAYINTDDFDGTLYSHKSIKTDTGTSPEDGGPEDGGPEDGGGPAGSGFTVQGYELISDIIKNGKDIFEPLYKLPPHIHRMRRHEDTSGTLVIVKECRQGSDEAKILEFLQTLTPPCKHIISLIETIVSHAGTTCVVLPERQSVKEQVEYFTDGGDLQGMLLDLSEDLTIGLSFLHKNGIAHLDIKPSNLVYTNGSHPQLEIIDFDIAVQVHNEEEEIDKYCGSRDWMAPEIGEENRPRQMYSPMRADKWSCGRVLRLFAERHGKADEGLRGFATRLMNRNPRKRPPLLEWHESRTKAAITVPEKRRLETIAVGTAPLV